MAIVNTIPVKNIVLPLERQQFWEIEHCIDFLQILHPILDWSFRLVSIPSWDYLDIFSMRGEMRVDEYEAGAKEKKGNCHSALNDQDYYYIMNHDYYHIMNHVKHCYKCNQHCNVIKKKTLVLNWAPGRVLKLSSSGIEQYQIKSLLVVVMVMKMMVTVMVMKIWEMVIIMFILIEQQDLPEEDGEVESSKRGWVEENMTWAERVL